MVKKKKACTCTADVIEKRRALYAGNKLKAAIETLFVTVDEDANGFLEQYEFAVLQAVVAELASEYCYTDLHIRAFDDIRAFDTNNDAIVSKKEFTATLMSMCDVIPCGRDELVNKIGKEVSYAVVETKRILGSEIRAFFASCDTNSDGTLDQSEIESMAKIAVSLSPASKDSQNAMDEFLTLRAFDCQCKKDRVDIGEFIHHFMNFNRILKVPKRDLVEKLRSLKNDGSMSN